MKTKTKNPKKCPCEKGECNCPAEDRGFMCTRQTGHEGNHMACGFEGSHRLHVWPQQEDKQ